MPVAIPIEQPKKDLWSRIKDVAKTSLDKIKPIVKQGGEKIRNAFKTSVDKLLYTDKMTYAPPGKIMTWTAGMPPDVLRAIDEDKDILLSEENPAALVKGVGGYLAGAVGRINEFIVAEVVADLAEKEFGIKPQETTFPPPLMSQKLEEEKRKMIVVAGKNLANEEIRRAESGAKVVAEHIINVFKEQQVVILEYFSTADEAGKSGGRLTGDIGFKLQKVGLSENVVKKFSLKLIKEETKDVNFQVTNHVVLMKALNKTVGKDFETWWKAQKDIAEAYSFYRKYNSLSQLMLHFLQDIRNKPSEILIDKTLIGRIQKVRKELDEDLTLEDKLILDNAVDFFKEQIKTALPKNLKMSYYLSTPIVKNLKFLYKKLRPVTTGRRYEKFKEIKLKIYNRFLEDLNRAIDLGPEAFIEGIFYVTGLNDENTDFVLGVMKKTKEEWKTKVYNQHPEMNMSSLRAVSAGKVGNYIKIMNTETGDLLFIIDQGMLHRVLVKRPVREYAKAEKKGE